MTDKYTMYDLEEEYDSFEPDRESIIYFSNHREEFTFKKIVELTNRIKELENDKWNVRRVYKIKNRRG